MSQSAPKWGTLPENLLRILIKDTVDLPDPDLTWPQAEIRRRQVSQALVKRFYAQVLYGCDYYYCKTPTCATCQKRTSKPPFRTFTPLSARALAVHLASQDRAEKYLCPHQPIQKSNAKGQVSPYRKGSSPGAVDRNKRSEGAVANAKSPVRLGHVITQETSKDAISATAADVVRPAISKQIDRKSLAQNMFNTAAVEMFYNTPTTELNFSIKPKDKIVSSGANPAKEEPGIPHSHDEEQSEACKDINRRSSQFPYRSQPCHDFTTYQIMSIDKSFEMDQRGGVFRETADTPETLARFTVQNVKALIKLVQHCEKISSKGQPSHCRPHPEATNVSQMRAKLRAFAAQSMFYIFNTPRALLASFREGASGDSFPTSTVSIDFGCMVQAFHWLQKFDEGLQLTMNNLPNAIRSLHVTSGGRGERRDSKPSKQCSQDKIPVQLRAISEDLGNVNSQVKDEREAAHLALQVFAVLVAIVPPCSLEEWHIVYTCHQAQCMEPPREVTDPTKIRSAQRILDAFEDEMALNLLSRLCEALATRSWIADMESIARTEQREKGIENSDVYRSVVEYVLDKLFESKRSPVPYRTRNGRLGWKYDVPEPDEESSIAPRYIGIIAEWLRYLVSKQWDGKADIDRFSAVGGALEILWCFACFRAINYAKMFEAYGGSSVATRLLNQMSFPDALTGRGEVRAQKKLADLLKSYFVMEIRRESVLLDAIEQLWRREQRDFMKPLKVRMGMDEGEEGVDHGGVQQEFFRLAIAEVMNPDYGMFTVDEQSGMSWFRPCSLEPMYKFEMVGLLFSLAIYNGLTLPVNFPLAFYRKLQGYEVTNPSQIRDGWPTLARGLQSLLDWSDGDVGDVFARTYDFTAEGPGFKITVDMEKNGRIKAWVPAELNPDWCCRYCSTMARPHVYKAHDTPVPPPEAEGPDENGDHDDEDNAKAPAPPKDLDLDDESVNEQESETAAELPSGPKPSTIPELSEGPEGVLVTNANREQYVSDYVFWLTNKSIRPQFQAFADNFYTCISTRAPSILDVRDFKRLVEGSTHDVSVSALESIAQYDGGYHPDHPTIKDFWDCVRDFAPGQIRSLLEFVTASDRIPATGWASVQFSVQKNGEGDERLPTSLTCYGRLLLPMYSGKSVLREKLGLAIENSKGFGVP